MSASRWSTCPRCQYRHEQKAKSLRAAALDSYGKVPLHEWLDRDDEASKAEEPFTRTTFREDWEIGSPEEGEVTFSYGGCCTACGLSLSFAHSEPIVGISEPATS